MGFKFAAFLVTCILVTIDVDATPTRGEIRAACSRLRQAVRVAKRPFLPNVYNPSSWVPFLDSSMNTMCSRAEALRVTWSEVGEVCTLDSSAVAHARFLLNITEMLCSQDVRQELGSFSSNECFTNDENRYSFSTEVQTCIENYMSVRYAAMHTSPEASCLMLYHNFGGCVTDATSLACGPEVARFVLPLWKVQDNDYCYRFADQI